ncbi:hypothetical protein WICPIJ_008449 [Wickerhamomyces pijperi]|uniref:Uncharacterized protein n=1 Tax=Wickerhamomyces pijperi TaxID=599730 RepID=A0A9P8TIV8_WICPI|nr:hypothetical protein WICPIJ_008449 [Wickerhamomyces pijperi]
MFNNLTLQNTTDKSMFQLFRNTTFLEVTIGLRKVNIQSRGGGSVNLSSQGLLTELTISTPETNDSTTSANLKVLEMDIALALPFTWMVAFLQSAMKID